MSFAELNMFYANMYQVMGLLSIGAAFLLWVGMRVTSVLVERETDNPIAKTLAVIFGLMVSGNWVFIGMQFNLQLANHAYGLKQLANQGVDVSGTSLAFIERMGATDAVPEPSLIGLNPFPLVIGLVALAFCIMPLFVPVKSGD